MKRLALYSLFALFTVFNIAGANAAHNDTIHVDRQLTYLIDSLRHKDIDTILVYKYMTNAEIKFDACVLADSNNNAVIECYIFWKKQGVENGINIDCVNNLVLLTQSDIFSKVSVFKKPIMKKGKSKFFPPIITHQNFWVISYYENQKKYFFTLDQSQVAGKSGKVWQREMPLIKNYWKLVTEIMRQIH